MEAIYRFMLWFSVSLVSTFFLITTIGNEFTKSFIIALVLSFVAVKND